MMDLHITNYMLLTVCCLVAVCGVWSQDSFYFDPSPVSQDVVEGEDVKLRCDVSSRRLIVFYWTLDGRTVANTTRRYQLLSDLLILSVNRTQDSGSFRCVALNVSTGIAVRSSAAALNIQWLGTPTLQVQQRQFTTSPTVTSSLSSSAPTNNQLELTFKCLTEGNPEPSIEWFRNYIRVLSTDRYRVQKNRLKLQLVSSLDNGVFKCRVHNAAGVSDSNLQIVNIPAVVGDSVTSLDTGTFTSSLTVVVGGSALFNCRYNSTTTTTTTRWQRLQQTLTNNTQYTVYSNGSLLVNAVSSIDVGVYVCVEVTSQQQFSVNLQLAYLNELLSETMFEPMLTSPVVLSSGAKLDVRCRPPRGQPAPQCWWVDGGRSVVGVEGRVKVTDVCRLVVTDVQVSDTGNYSCYVQNTAASRRHSFTLVVTVLPSMVRSPVSQTATVGNTVTFDCQFTGTQFPFTVVSWLKDGRPLDSRDGRWHVNQSSGTLTLSLLRLSDEGRYSCQINTTSQRVVTSLTAQLTVNSLFGVDTLRREAATGSDTGSNTGSNTGSDGGGRHNGVNDSGSSDVIDSAVSCDSSNVNMSAPADVVVSRTVIVIVCCGVVYVALMSVVCVYCIVHKHRSRGQRTNSPHRTINTDVKCSRSVTLDEGQQLMLQETIVSSQSDCLKVVTSDFDSSIRSHGSTSPAHSTVYGVTTPSLASSAQLTATTTTTTTTTIPSLPTMSRHQIQVLGLLGNGDYGDIMLACVESNVSETTVIIVKSLLSVSSHHVAAFQHDIEMFRRGTQQSHVSRLVGVCCNIEPALLVLEYCQLGDLKRLLQSTAVPLSLSQRVLMCYQASVAVSHLTTLNITHCDVAARNFLVCPSLDVKLSSVATVCGADSSDYCLLTGRLVPLRWMSPEATLAGSWTSAADVWALAVTFTEIFSNAATPYCNLSNDDVLLSLAAGTLHPVSHSCPDAIQQLLVGCCQHKSCDRLSANQIVAYVGRLLNASEQMQ